MYLSYLAVPTFISDMAMGYYLKPFAVGASRSREYDSSGRSGLTFPLQQLGVIWA
jgi:hypothetical protein